LTLFLKKIYVWSIGPLSLFLCPDDKYEAYNYEETFLKKEGHLVFVVLQYAKPSAKTGGFFLNYG